MNLNVYLPDEVGERAKADGLNLSRLLRDAVNAELQRREAVRDVAQRHPEQAQVYEFTWQHDSVARVTGWRLWPDHNDDILQIFATSDGRLLAVYPDQQLTTWLNEPGKNLVTRMLEVGLEGDELREAFQAIGLKPVIDL